MLCSFLILLLCIHYSFFLEGLFPHKCYSAASLKHRQSSTLGSFLRLNKLRALHHLTTLNLTAWYTVLQLLVYLCNPIRSQTASWGQVLFIVQLFLSKKQNIQLFLSNKQNTKHQDKYLLKWRITLQWDPWFSLKSFWKRLWS